MLKKEGFPPWQWAEFRSAMFLLLASVSSAFADDSIPDAEYTSVPTALSVFSSLVMVRFVFFSERYRKYPKVFWALVLFFAIGLLLTIFCIFLTYNKESLIYNRASETLITIQRNINSLLNLLDYFYGILIISGIIATITSLIIGFFLIYKKNKFIIISALSILAIEIVTVILIIKYDIIDYEEMILTCVYLAPLNGILGIISIICLLISLRSKITATG